MEISESQMQPLPQINEYWSQVSWELYEMGYYIPCLLDNSEHREQLDGATLYSMAVIHQIYIYQDQWSPETMAHSLSKRLGFY